MNETESPAWGSPFALANVHAYFWTGAVGDGPPPESPPRLAAGYAAAKAATASAAASARRMFCVCDISLTPPFASSRFHMARASGGSLTADYLRGNAALTRYGVLRCCQRFATSVLTPGSQTLLARENAPAAKTLAPAGVS